MPSANLRMVQAVSFFGVVCRLCSVPNGLLGNCERGGTETQSPFCIKETEIQIGD